MKTYKFITNYQLKQIHIMNVGEKKVFDSKTYERTENGVWLEEEVKE